MNSKERVRAAIARQPVDQAPLGFYLVDHDIISRVIGRPTYLRNRTAYEIAIWEGRRDEVVAAMKADIVDFYRQIDCADLLTFKEAQMVPPRGYTPEDPPRRIGDNLYRDSRGNTFRLSPETNDITQVAWETPPGGLPEYTIEMFADRSSPPVPDASCFELSDHLVREFGRDRYIAGYTGGTTALTLLGGMESGMMLLALQPEVVDAASEQQAAQQDLLDAVQIRPGMDGVLMEQDFGGTTAPLISPGMFRQHCFPFLKRRIAHVKQHVAQVIFHSCGSTMPLMDMLLAAGIDAYESIQTNAAGMTIEEIAGKYGRQVCVWGAIPLEVLITGSPDDVRKAVRRSMEAGRNAPGFILGPSHSIAFGTKYDNFMALLDEFCRLR